MPERHVQVRRKADPAKTLVKGWIQDWKERSELEQEVSHRELSGEAAAGTSQQGARLHCSTLSIKAR